MLKRQRATATPTSKESLREKPVSLGRHARDCRICSHPQREEIERDFVAWKSPQVITKEYRLKNRATVYRHAHALGLFAKRARNVRAALERIIKQAGEVEVNAAAVVGAMRTYASFNSVGMVGPPAISLPQDSVWGARPAFFLWTDTECRVVEDVAVEM